MPLPAIDEVVDGDLPAATRFTLLENKIAICIFIESVDNVNISGRPPFWAGRFRVLLQYREDLFGKGAGKAPIIPELLTGALEEARELYSSTSVKEGVVSVNSAWGCRFQMYGGNNILHFPFDTHECMLTVQLDHIANQQKRDVRFVRLGGGFRDNPAKALHCVRDFSSVSEEWTLHQPLFCIARDPVSGWKSVVEFSFLVARRPGGELLGARRHFYTSPPPPPLTFPPQACPPPPQLFYSTASYWPFC